MFGGIFMFYDRQIKYLDYFENGERIRGGGFVKLEARERQLRIEVTVTGLYQNDSFTREVLLCSGTQEKVIGRILITAGRGQYRQLYPDLNTLGDTGISYGKLQGIRIPLGRDRELISHWSGTGATDAGERVHGLEISAAELPENDRLESCDERMRNRLPEKNVKETSEESERNRSKIQNWGIERQNACVHKSPEKEQKLPNPEEMDSQIEKSYGEIQSGIWKVIQNIEELDENPPDSLKSTETMEKTTENPQTETKTDEKNTKKPTEGKQEPIQRKENHTTETPLEPLQRGTEPPKNTAAGSGRNTTEGTGRNRTEMIKRNTLETTGKNTSKTPARNVTDATTATGRRTAAGNTMSTPKTYPGEQPRKIETTSTGRQRIENTGRLIKLAEDKWQQLCAIYPHIHPFHDKREYLSIGPSDFVIFPAASYKIINNSFLLHGYYNYHHLILTRIEKKGEPVYYIGVPGAFYEKEKQVAIMFGFESFECEEEPAQTGDFGYYMMRTQL